jgi:exoribonuclease-2
MNVFYEEAGSLKAASIVEDNNTSLQVQTQHGKRAKVKAGSVLLRFEHSSLSAFMEETRAVADDIDPGFLWEACGQSEFSFDALAADYFGREPRAEESAGLLTRLQATPTHFYKKGKGRYKPAPPDALKAALASIERKRIEAELQAGYVASLMRHELPEAFEPILQQLLYKPDRNLVETKALEEACSQQKLSVVRLLEKCGAITSSLDYHHGRFLFEYFPGGTGFEHELETTFADELDLAPVQAFSIDDVTTTEIDDAFSVTRMGNGNRLIGVHIAAPALGIEVETGLDTEARKRMSTVYFPGDKITMLSESAIALFTLVEGKDRPAISMYVEVNPDLEILEIHTTLERVQIARNLRHDALEVRFSEQAVAAGEVDFEYGEELLLLYRFANILERRRGKDNNGTDRVDYSFYVDDDRVRIAPRNRGSAIDKVVSELMILVNGEWARKLTEAKLPGFYRTQTNGKVRMSTVPAPHEGLGLGQYIWASSPLRRYADLVNQRQLVSILRGASPVYAPRDERLFEIMRDFEFAYDAYAEHQRLMERYWCLRWLVQEDVMDVQAQVIRDDLARIDGIPLVCRIQSLPQLARGDRVQLRVSDIDLFELTLRCEYQRTLSPET